MVLKKKKNSNVIRTLHVDDGVVSFVSLNKNLVMMLCANIGTLTG